MNDSFKRLSDAYDLEISYPHFLELTDYTSLSLSLPEVPVPVSESLSLVKLRSATSDDEEVTPSGV